MGTFLINASNLKAGGGIQVAQSICQELVKYKQHHFVVVLSSKIPFEDVEGENISLYTYDINHKITTILWGKEAFLDNLVLSKQVEAVLTIFGPSLWRPKVPHLCGFARAQLVLKDSPYYQKRSFREWIVYKIWKWLFKKSSNTFYTENEYISSLLPKEFGNKIKIFTVTNYYNQVFDLPEKWKKSIELPEFDGITCLSVSSHYSHKNFEMLKDVVYSFRRLYPCLNIRFVLTFDENEMPVPQDIRNSFLFIGKVDVADCPNLYKQSDIMIMPSLMECFTATYPEAMRMEVPIVTTDLMFARGLCGNAACYYNAIDAEKAAEAIYKVMTDKDYAKQLVDNGKRQLLSYDDYQMRAKKLIGILEELVDL